MSLIKFTQVHMGSDKILILKSNVEENAFLLIGREDYFKNLIGYHQLRCEGADGWRPQGNAPGYQLLPR